MLRRLTPRIALLRDASAPAVIAGIEVYRSGAWNELRTFAESSGIPVFTEYEALGTLPSDHPLWMGHQLPTRKTQTESEAGCGTRAGFTVRMEHA
ncbi:MAG: hypothetical protein WDM77_10690 [Steroidobacteraceae bacterium]